MATTAVGAVAFAGHALPFRFTLGFGGEREPAPPPREDARTVRVPAAPVEVV